MEEDGTSCVNARLNLGIQLGMGMKKIKVYTLTEEGSSPKCIGTMKGRMENP